MWQHVGWYLTAPHGAGHVPQGPGGQASLSDPASHSLRHTVSAVAGSSCCPRFWFHSGCPIICSHRQHTSVLEKQISNPVKISLESEGDEDSQLPPLPLPKGDHSKERAVRSRLPDGHTQVTLGDRPRDKTILTVSCGCKAFTELKHRIPTAHECTGEVNGINSDLVLGGGGAVFDMSGHLL